MPIAAIAVEIEHTEDLWAPQFGWIAQSFEYYGFGADDAPLRHEPDENANGVDILTYFAAVHQHLAMGGWSGGLSRFPAEGWAGPHFPPTWRQAG
jgi:hypothetical protein